MKKTLQAHSPAELAWPTAGAIATVISSAMASCDDTALTCSVWNVTSHKANSDLAAKSWSGIASEALVRGGRVDSVAPTLPRPVAVACEEKLGGFSIKNNGFASGKYSNEVHVHTNTLWCDGGADDEYSHGIRIDAVASDVVTSYQ